MSKVLVISDMHFGHRGIIKFRKNFFLKNNIASIEEHDQLICENILSCLNKRDILWILGDCFFSEDTYRYARAMAKACMQLNLVIGNHDTDKPERMEALKKGICEGVFWKVGTLFKAGPFWLSHAPIHPEELRGRKNVHGHVHYQTIRDPNYLNVCCENVNYFPVNLQDLINMPERVLEVYGR